jgi:hypothetical protein
MGNSVINKVRTWLNVSAFGFGSKCTARGNTRYCFIVVKLCLPS